MAELHLRLVPAGGPPDLNQRCAAEDAIREFQAALKADPHYLASLNNLGLAFLQTGRWEEAIAQYRTLIAMNSDIAEAYYNLGTALKHYDGAADAFRKSLHVDPGFPEAHCALGEVLWEQGKLDDAAGELNAVVEARSDFIPAYLILANLRRQKGDLSGALTALQTVLKLAPRDGAAYQALGIVLKQKGETNGAAEALRRAQGLKEPAMTCEAARRATDAGALLLRQGNISGSIEKLRLAVTLVPYFALAHYHRLGFSRGRDLSQASAEFNNAHELDPRLQPPRE